MVEHKLMAYMVVSYTNKFSESRLLTVSRARDSELKLSRGKSMKRDE